MIYFNIVMSVSDKLDTESVLLIAEGKKAQKKG